MGATNSRTPSASEAPKKAESGQLEAVYENVMTKVFGEVQPNLMKNQDTAQIKELYGLKADMMNVNVDTFIGIEEAQGKANKLLKSLPSTKTR